MALYKNVEEEANKMVTRNVGYLKTRRLLKLTEKSKGRFTEYLLK